MYLSTAFITGLFVVTMFVIVPRDIRLARGVLFVLAVILIVGSLPYRKGVAVAIEYLVDRRWGEGAQE